MKNKEKILTKDFNLLTLSNFAVFAGMYFLIVTLPIYLLKIGGKESAIGLIIGIFTIAGVVSRPFFGKIVDRKSKKKILITGISILIISSLLYSYITSTVFFLLLRIFHGIGWGAAITAAYALIADITPKKRKGEAMGIYGTANSIAMAIVPALSILLLNATSFTILFLICAGTSLFGLILILPVKDKKAMHKESHFLNKRAIFPSTIIFIVTLSYGALISFISLFAQKQGILNPGIFFTIFAISLILARIIGGKLSDIKGRGYIIIPGMILISLGLFVLAVAHSLIVFLISAFLYGFGFGSVQPTLAALVVDRVKGKGLGSAMSTYTGAIDLGIGLGSVFLGLLVAPFGFKTMYVVAGFIVLAGLVIFALNNKKEEIKKRK